MAGPGDTSIFNNIKDMAVAILVIGVVAVLAFFIIGILGTSLITATPSVPTSSPAYNVSQQVYHGISTTTGYMPLLFEILFIGAIIAVIGFAVFPIIQKWSSGG